MALSSIVRRKSLHSLKMQCPKLAATATATLNLSPSISLFQSSSEPPRFKMPYTTTPPVSFLNYNSSNGFNRKPNALHEMQCRSYITVTDVLRMYLKHANDKLKLLNDKLKNVNPKLEGYQFLRLIFSVNRNLYILKEAADILKEYVLYTKSLEDAANMGYVFEDYEDFFKSLQHGDWVYLENLMSMEEDCEYLKDLIDNMKDFHVNFIRFGDNLSRCLMLQRFILWII